MRERVFKGWTKPGPVASGADLAVVGDDESLDALSGDFRIFQLRAGHRFSTDDLLVAYYGTTWCPSAQRILELGSGIGTIGMIAAWRLPGAQVVMIEAQEQSASLARKSLAYNGLAQRCELRVGDFRRSDIVAPGEVFDLVLGSPPYFAPDAGALGDHPQKVACRFELRGDISDYANVAAAHLAPGGVFACVFPVEPAFQANRVVAAARGAGMCIVRRRMVSLKQGAAPLLGLFVMMRATDLPDWFRDQTFTEPVLTIRTESGSVHPEYMALKLMLGFPP